MLARPSAGLCHCSRTLLVAPPKSVEDGAVAPGAPHRGARNNRRHHAETRLRHRSGLQAWGSTVTQMTTISPEKILQLGSAFWASKTLLSAVELGVFTALAERGPLSLAELRE